MYPLSRRIFSRHRAPDTTRSVHIREAKHPSSSPVEFSLPVITPRMHGYSLSKRRLNQVREKALESIEAVARCLSPEQLSGHMVPLVSRLTTKEWFTARMSACCLAAPTYSLLSADSKGGQEGRMEVRELFKKLCRDDTPMVRR